MLQTVEKFIGVWSRVGIEGIDDVVMEIESASEAVTWRGLLQRIKTSKLYANRRTVISAMCKREAVMAYWWTRGSI